MAAFRLLVCFIISTLWFCSIINAAAVYNSIPSDEYDHGNELKDYRGENDGFKDLLLRRIRDRRSVDVSENCSETMPCGWAVYVPFKRRVDYFMRNTCSCPTTHKCIRTDDDLSVSAYVYRCRSNFTATDIESPDNAN